MPIKKIKTCPKNKSIKLKGWRCKRCKHYNKKQWFSYGKPVDTFCTLDMNDTEKKYLT